MQKFDWNPSYKSRQYGPLLILTQSRLIIRATYFFSRSNPPPDFYKFFEIGKLVTEAVKTETRALEKIFQALEAELEEEKHERRKLM